LIEHLLCSDNDIRKAAEMKLDQLREKRPEQLLRDLIVYIEQNGGVNEKEKQ